MKSALELLRELRAGNIVAPQLDGLPTCRNHALVTGEAPPGTAGSLADEPPKDWIGIRVASRVLGEDVWLVPDELSAETLERELPAAEKTLLIFTVAEVHGMQKMLAADMRTLGNIKRWFPGSRIDNVTRRSGNSE